MGVKGYHFYLRKLGGYSTVNLREFTKERPISMIVVDFCAVYMPKLKAPDTAKGFLLAKLMEKGKLNIYILCEFALNICV